jgi:hypothetical protein
MLQSALLSESAGCAPLLQFVRDLDASESKADSTPAASAPVSLLPTKPPLPAKPTSAVVTFSVLIGRDSSGGFGVLFSPYVAASMPHCDVRLADNTDVFFEFQV